MGPSQSASAAVGWWRLATVALLFAVVAPAAAQDAPTSPLTLRAPDTQTFDLALDELWIDAPNAESLRAEQLSAHGLRPGRRVGRLQAVHVDDARSAQDLVSRGRSIQRASPGSAFMLALYDRGAPHDDAHRALLTGDVALLIEPGQHAARIAGASARLEAIPNVPNAYVVHADDPFAAVALAETLASQQGVRQAYPLLKRVMFTR